MAVVERLSWAATAPKEKGAHIWAAYALVMCIAVMSCSGDSATAPTPPTPPIPPYEGPIQLASLETYDGSGQAVHPDVVVTPVGWGDGRAHLVVTPYPKGNATFENPSIYVDVGQSSPDWQVPGGVSNPLVLPPTSGGYLSDPDQLYDPATNELWLYYRQVTTVNQILLIRSPDGVQWSAPVVVVTAPNHFAISPTVVRRGAGDWLMWTVNGGNMGCAGRSTTVELRRSTDGVAWSDPETVQLGDTTQLPWHIDVTWIAERGEFWALFNVKTSGSCTTKKLIFATSQDGVHWTTAPTPLLQNGAIPEFADIVYRSAVSYDPAADDVTLWYSGAQYADNSYVWRVAVQHMSLAALFASVAQHAVASSGSAPKSKMALAPPILRPELTNETAP